MSKLHASKTSFLLEIVLVSLSGVPAVCAAFPSLSAGDFEDNRRAFASISPFPDSRQYAIETLDSPHGLSPEEMSAKQAAKGSNWYSAGSFNLRLSRRGVAKYIQEDAKALKQFFDHVVASSETMRSMRYAIVGRIAKRSSRRREDLVVKVVDRRLSENVQTLGGCCAALITPLDPDQIADGSPGDVVELDVTIYKLLDAYQTMLPTVQNQAPVLVKTYFTRNGAYVTEKATRTAVSSGVGYRKWPSARLTVIAGWAMGLDVDFDSGAFTLPIGLLDRHTTPALLDSGGLEAELSLLDAAERFPEIAVQQQAERKAAAEAEASRIAAAEEKNKAVVANGQPSLQERIEARRRAMEENKPRALLWKMISLGVLCLTFASVAFFLYVRTPSLHSRWVCSKPTQGRDTRVMAGAAWLGILLPMALTAYGAKPAPDSLWNAWFICGIGGLVAMFILPICNGAAMFRRTDQEKIDSAVSDAVHRATGRVDIVGLIWPLFRFIILPLAIGGVFCPVLWMYAMAKNTSTATDLYKSRIPVEPEEVEETL